MHFYKRNIGDYAKKTGRLTFIQHGAYTLLMDACYDRERFPTLDEAYEWTWAIADEEKAAVEFVLKRFFTLQDGRYIQNRVQEEVADYNGKALKNQQIAVEREAKRKQESTNRARVVHEPPPNHKPLTTNQEPLTINQEPIKHTDTELAPTLPTQAGAVCVLLKSKGIGSTNPGNQKLKALLNAGASIGAFDAAADIAKERKKGFEYVLGIVQKQIESSADLARQTSTSARQSSQVETAYQRSMRERWEEATGQRSIEHSNVIDITPMQAEQARIA